MRTVEEMAVSQCDTHDLLAIGALIAELAVTWEMPGADSFARARTAAAVGDMATFASAVAAALCANATSAGAGYDIARHLCDLVTASGERNRHGNVDVSVTHLSFLVAHLTYLQRVTPRPLPAALQFWSDGMAPQDAVWAADNVAAVH